MAAAWLPESRAAAEGGLTFSDANWISMGGNAGTDGPVYAAVTDQAGNLYVGGRFGIAGEVQAANIAKWDGIRWSALGAGVNGWVMALAVAADGTLYAGGPFTTAGGTSVNYLARWDGTTWSPLGTGMDNRVFVLAPAGDGTLYAGGVFDRAGDVFAHKIAQWDGTQWSALGSGMNGPVNALLAGDDGRLYAGGGFTLAGGVEAQHLAMWDGTQWSALGAGVNETVLALAETGTDLYVGGRFSLAGGKVSVSLAKAESLVARNATYARRPGEALEVPLAEVTGDLLFGHPVSVQAAGPSDHGVPVTYDDTHFFYAPATDHNQDDVFEYTVSNGRGTKTGRITIRVVPDGGVVEKITVTDESVTLRCRGIPGRSYDGQRATALTAGGDWTTLTSPPLTPETDGSFRFLDDDPPGGAAYYRLQQR